MNYKIGWRFAPLCGGNRQGYTNNDMEVFKGMQLIDNLAREICQNSLDAHVKNSNEPVKVVFELKNMRTDKYEVFGQYAHCIRGCEQYWGSDMDKRLSAFICGAKDILQKDNIPTLVVSDYNTTGLKGCGKGKDELNSSWNALTKSEGVTADKPTDGLGAYGIGKNAPFACSSLGMVFYNTVNEDKETAFVGVAHLATL